MNEPENPFKMPDARLTRLGRRYRALCRIQGNDVLMRGARVITFEQYIADQNAAEHIRSSLHRWASSAAPSPGR